MNVTEKVFLCTCFLTSSVICTSGIVGSDGRYFVEIGKLFPLAVLIDLVGPHPCRRVELSF